MPFACPFDVDGTRNEGGFAALLADETGVTVRDVAADGTFEASWGFRGMGESGVIPFMPVPALARPLGVAGTAVCVDVVDRLDEDEEGDSGREEVDGENVVGVEGADEEAAAAFRAASSEAMWRACNAESDSTKRYAANSVLSECK